MNRMRIVAALVLIRNIGGDMTGVFHLLLHIQPAIDGQGFAGDETGVVLG